MFLGRTERAQTPWNNISTLGAFREMMLLRRAGEAEPDYTGPGEDRIKATLGEVSNGIAEASMSVLLAFHAK